MASIKMGSKNTAYAYVARVGQGSASRNYEFCSAISECAWFKSHFSLANEQLQ